MLSFRHAPSFLVSALTFWVAAAPSPAVPAERFVGGGGWHELIAERINKFLRSHHPSGSIAVLELDETMISGDVSEALLAQLQALGRMDQRWRELPTAVKVRTYDEPFAIYDRICVELGRAQCRAWLAQALAGFDIDDLVKAVDDLGRSPKAQTVKSSAEKSIVVRDPRPYPEMKQLVKALESASIDVYVITASPVVAARAYAAKHFGIAENRVYGIANLLELRGTVYRDIERIQTNGRMDLYERMTLLPILDMPVPYAEGKAALLRHLTGSTREPIFTAGSELDDLPMMFETSGDGLRLWIDRSDVQPGGTTRTDAARIEIQRRIEAGEEKDDNWSFQYADADRAVFLSARPDQPEYRFKKRGEP